MFQKDILFGTFNYPVWNAYDLIEAYGPTFLHFVIVFVLCVVVARSLGQADRLGAEPYAQQRHPLRSRLTPAAKVEP